MPYQFLNIDRNVFYGSMHGQAAYTKVIWLICLFECTGGRLTITRERLAQLANVALEAVDKALAVLLAPDPHSTSLSYDGRRLLAVEGQRHTYEIVNWAIYQPALTNDCGRNGAPLITPRDAAGNPISKRKPDGSLNPEYQRVYQRMRREIQKASKAISDDCTAIVNSVNQSKPVYETPTEQPSDTLEFEPDSSENVNPVNKGKENKTKPNPPIVPRKPKAVKEFSALTEDLWRQFLEGYYRPSTGRSYGIAHGRTIFDALFESGADMGQIITAAAKYGAYIKKTGREKFVCMIPTWLNQKRWLENYDLDPGSDEAKAAAQRDLAAKERAMAKAKAELHTVYTEFVADFVTQNMESGYEIAWTEHQLARIDGYTKEKLHAAAGKIRAMLDDEDKRLETMRAAWLETPAGQKCPTFEAWFKNRS